MQIYLVRCSLKTGEGLWLWLSVKALGSIPKTVFSQTTNLHLVLLVFDCVTLGKEICHLLPLWSATG